MGTSVSYPSPKTTGWKASLLGYSKSDIPIERIISEIWRASQSQPKSLPERIKSESLFICQEAIRGSSDASEALKNVTNELVKSKQNSIVTEYAKRSIPAAFKSSDPVREWRSVFFAELTNYLVSRDISGYLGKDYRNKTINDLITFKKSIKQHVGNVMKELKFEPSTSEKWKIYVEKAITEISKGAK